MICPTIDRRIFYLLKLKFGQKLQPFDFSKTATTMFAEQQTSYQWSLSFGLQMYFYVGVDADGTTQSYTACDLIPI